MFSSAKQKSLKTNKTIDYLDHLTEDVERKLCCHSRSISCGVLPSFALICDFHNTVKSYHLENARFNFQISSLISPKPHTMQSKSTTCMLSAKSTGVH